jgi:hypothetical protein
MTTSVPGQGAVRVEEIMDGLVLYMRSDALAGALPISVDLTIDYKRFGVPVDVHAPAASETADAADLSGG